MHLPEPPALCTHNTVNVTCSGLAFFLKISRRKVHSRPAGLSARAAAGWLLQALASDPSFSAGDVIGSGFSPMSSGGEEAAASAWSSGTERASSRSPIEAGQKVLWEECQDSFSARHWSSYKPAIDGKS